MQLLCPRSQISENALKVLYRLNNAGYKAYLVGGSVRDLLIGIQPKDFDVVTDAKPEQIRELFRNRTEHTHRIFPVTLCWFSNQT